MRKLFFFIVFLLGITFVHSQEKGKSETESLYFEIDSLKNVVRTATIDSIKIQNLYSIGSIFHKNAIKDSAVFYTNKGINLSQHSKIPKLQGRGYIMLGNFNLYHYDYTNAFKNYSKVDSICNLHKDLKVSILRAQAYNYIGYSVRLTHDYDKAGEYYQKAKTMYETLGYEPGVQEVNIGLAQLYISKNEYSKALDLFNKAIEYHTVNGPENSLSYAAICRGYLLVKMKEFNEAEKDYQLYYDIAFKEKNIAKQLRALSYFGYFHSQAGNYDRAVSYYNDGINLSDETNYLSMKEEMYNGLIGIYSKQKNAVKLNDAYKNYIATRNKIDSINKDEEIYNLETKFQTKQKEQEITLLKSQNELAEQRQKSQTQLFIGMLTIGLIIGGFLLYAYRNKLKTAQKLKELDGLKSKFFANISHEFRTPLTLIKSPLQLLKNGETDASKIKQLSMIEQHSDRMLSLVDQLLQLSKIDSGNLKLILQKSNLSTFLEILTEPFKINAEEAGFKFKKNIEKSQDSHWFDKDIIEKITTNLLSNTLKYTSENGLIWIESSIKNDTFHLNISNATTLPNRDVSKLFERFYKDNNASDGVGIGLALVQELVTLYKGSIDASTQNDILKFSVSLPLNKELLKDVSVILEETKNDEILKESENLEELPIMLIVDDNNDIRAVLKEIFKPDYHILEASEGETGLKLAIESIPNIILSDIMMPNMDGFELTDKLKKNEATSFIPIILLTAKTSDESKLKGLQIEADDYITKPFNHDILKTKVQQLIEVRRKLQERYSKELVLKPVDITITPADEKFIQRLEQVLEKELSNSEYTIDDFAKAVGMSRMQLHRKLKSLFGVSATEFIRNERIKAAAILIEKGGINISEIGYAVGFTDMSYFAKCFKDIYGVTPSNYHPNS
ncbi:response regulator [Subsaxibacter sp. CAU 1640]|uniref:response regulator n=1 Tax=Subsaxibacter sp. CAU 1640 TaxID=2933271 RepID=UPI00200496EE|nr:response regulator [Subsaxibacter sp. CAU 1640]MCK7588952.1 response regulator [Subsaxibacter sp. CAU 1640]